ncbi:endonuclease III [bacterium]|nr:endonuclease III [bacterium]
MKPENTLESLVRGLLSQNTSDHNRDMAFDRLKKLIPDFNELLKTDVKEIEEAIKPAGLYKQRAARIKSLVEWLNAKRGNLQCDFLCQSNPHEAFETLVKSQGIGVKTAAVFLLFNCGFGFFPVDTHIKRIFTRMGFYPPNYNAEKIQLDLAPFVPQKIAYDLHLNLLKLGRGICSSRNPKCFGCPVVDLCCMGNHIIYQSNKL